MASASGRSSPPSPPRAAGDFFVATLDEGRAVRRIAPRAVVYVLGGALGGAEREFVRHGLIPVLNDLDAAARWAALARADGIARTAALHIDTGMNRLGFSPEEAERLATDPRMARRAVAASS